MLDGLDQRRLHLANKAVSLHGKAGNLEHACEIFDRMPCHSLVTWNSLMLGYAENGQGQIALEIFQRMRIEGFHPDSRSFVAAFKACSVAIDRTGGDGAESVKRRGIEIHQEAIDLGCDSNEFVATSLIDMYGRFQWLHCARQVFEAMDPGKRSLASSNSLILRYAAHGDGELALEIFDGIKDLSPDARSFAAAAKSCGAIATKKNGEKSDVEALRKGMEIHDLAYRNGFDTDLYVANSLISMYMKLGKVVDAKRVFDRIPRPSLVSWNSLLLGYAQSDSHASLALETFSEMVATRNWHPDGRTFLAALKACSTLAEKELERRVGDKVVKATSLEKGMFFHSRAVATLSGGDLDVFLTSALVDLYMKCGSLEDARHIFDRMRRRNVVSWTALSTGYLENGKAELALELLPTMQAELAGGDVSAEAAFVPAARACAALAAKEEPEEVDGGPVKIKSLELGMFIQSRAGSFGAVLGTALIDIYSECGSLVDAVRAFDTTVHPDLASWNALILACADNDRNELALELFQFLLDRCTPNSRTFAAAMKACGKVSDVKVLTAIRAELCRRVSENDCFLETCLVDACSKTGSIAGAQLVFDSITCKSDSAIWNSLIAGYSRRGDATSVIRLFHQMYSEGIQADGETFVALLTACSHAGLVESGKRLFKEMTTRANALDEAVTTVKSMPDDDGDETVVAWMAVLNACVKAGNLVLGIQAFDAMLAMDKINDAAYNMMASLCGKM